MKAVLVLDLDRPGRPVAKTPLFGDQVEHRDHAVFDSLSEAGAFFPVLVDKVKVGASEVEIVPRQRRALDVDGPSWTVIKYPKAVLTQAV